MNIKCAIFDFDGTLFDSMYIWETAGETYLRSVGAEPKPSLREDVRTLSLRQAASHMKKEYGLVLTIEEIMTGINKTIEAAYLHDVLPKPGVKALLERLRQDGISLCIATATDRYLIEAALKRCQMAHYFDTIFTCSEVGHGKDEPVIFRQAMDFCQADRSSTVIFEDAFHAAETAKKDGFFVVAIADSSEKKQDELKKLSDMYVADFEQLKPFWE